MVDSDRSCVNHSSDDDCSDEEAVGEHIRDQKDDEDNEEEGAEVAERDASALTANTTPPVLWQCAQRGDSEGLAQILAHRLRPTSNGSIPSSSSSNSSSSYGEGGSFLDVNVVWEGGVSALLVAAANGHATCCTLLLKAGANPDLGDDQGTTALMMAAQVWFLHHIRTENSMFIIDIFLFSLLFLVFFFTSLLLRPMNARCS